VGPWRAWYARCTPRMHHHAPREAKAGTFARRLQREGEALWVLLDGPAVDPTNNSAERAHRWGAFGDSAVP
jgi:hypothetical protein